MVYTSAMGTNAAWRVGSCAGILFNDKIKGIVLLCKRYAFTLQYLCFCRVKPYLLFSTW